MYTIKVVIKKTPIYVALLSPSWDYKSVKVLNNCIHICILDMSSLIGLRCHNSPLHSCPFKSFGGWVNGRTELKEKKGGHTHTHARRHFIPLLY